MVPLALLLMEAAREGEKGGRGRDGTQAKGNVRRENIRGQRWQYNVQTEPEVDSIRVRIKENYYWQVNC